MLAIPSFNPSSNRKQAIEQHTEKLLSTGKIRVLVTDDYPIVREGLNAFLGRQPDIEVTGSVLGESPESERQSEFTPDVVLFDFNAEMSVFGVARR